MSTVASNQTRGRKKSGRIPAVVSIPEKEAEMAYLAAKHGQRQKGLTFVCPSCGSNISGHKYPAHLERCADDLVLRPCSNDPQTAHDYACVTESKLRETAVQLRFGGSNRMSVEETAAVLGLSVERIARACRRASLSYPMVVDPGDDLEIIFEDKDMVVVNKPPGITHHPRHRWEGGSLLNKVLGHVAEQGETHEVVAPVHRLDHDTSGVTIFAKGRASASVLGRMLTQKAGGGYGVAVKEYLAISKVEDFSILEHRLDTSGMDNSFVVEARLATAPRVPGFGNPTRVQVSDRGKKAKTRFSILASNSAHALFLCELYTGRTHQIRVHLQSLQSSIVGDKLYSSENSSPPPTTIARQALHAWRLQILHPRTLIPVEFVAPLPDDFRGALRQYQIDVPLKH
jgi:23S rRNA pseudouridine1911/1915/1917 synthase